jgi:TIR domain
VTAGAVKVFYSYSRKDQALREKLDQHLAPLRFGGRISTWHDLQLEPGSDWNRDIDNQLDTAHIILLLVSANFLSSEYCYSIELKRSLERAARQEACVIPVILEPCDWKHDGIPFSKLAALPNHEKAITEWENREAAFKCVAQSIREKVQKLIQQTKDNEVAKKQTVQEPSPRRTTASEKIGNEANVNDGIDSVKLMYKIGHTVISEAASVQINKTLNKTFDYVGCSLGLLCRRCKLADCNCKALYPDTRFGAPWDQM